jgi:transcriptional regulator with XRE-family HTH domain
MRARATHVRIEVGKRLRLLREGLKMKQIALCRLTGITGQAWNNAETGDNLLTVVNAIEICRVTGVTLDWIYRGQITALPSIVLTAITKPRQKGTS